MCRTYADSSLQTMRKKGGQHYQCYASIVSCGTTKISAICYETMRICTKWYRWRLLHLEISFDHLNLKDGRRERTMNTAMYLYSVIRKDTAPSLIAS